MSQINRIQIISEEFRVEIKTSSEITPMLINRIEKQLNAVVNENFYHDIYGRITSINMSMYMLERMIQPDAKTQFQLLKAQIEDLSRMIEEH